MRSEFFVIPLFCNGCGGVDRTPLLRERRIGR
jgi:hypothetical protein